MIRHKTPCDSRAVVRKQSLVKIKKGYIVFSVKENPLPVISLVVNMVNIIGSERHIRISLTVSV